MDADAAVRLGEAHEIAGELAAAEAQYRAGRSGSRPRPPEAPAQA